MVDLMFLDESSRVVTQNQGRISPRQTRLESHEANTELNERIKKQKSPGSPLQLTGFVMYQPLDDLGVNFFMNNFMVDDPNMSLIHYLPSYYAKTGFSGPALRQMCAAVGLVSLANRSHRKDMLDVATNYYAAAIRVINTALLCPKRAAQDSILASIFMAAMFEALIIPRHRGMDNCCTHLSGAVSVANLILKQGKQTDVTMQQCTALVKTVIMNCWVQDVSLPPNFAEFKNLVEKKAARVSLHDSFLNIVMELLEFKKEIQDSLQDLPVAIIKRALEIDASLEEFAYTLDCQVPFETVQLSIPKSEQLAYKGCYHSKCLRSGTYSYPILTYMDSISSAPARSSMEQCPVIPYTPPSAHPTNMQRSCIDSNPKHPTNNIRSRHQRTSHRNSCERASASRIPARA
jgi:hypothetical protein